MRESGRFLAGLVAAVALLSVLLRMGAAQAETGGGPALLWTLAADYAVLTALLVAWLLGAAALGVDLNAKQAGALTVWALAAGAIYLAGFRADGLDPKLRVVADIGLYGATPLLTGVFWLFHARKSTLDMDDVSVWLIWPAVFAAYALLRTALTGGAGSPYADASESATGPALAAVFLIVVSAGIGVALVLIARVLRREDA
ncbi:MAG: hypothetical protein ACRCSU_02980 [Paracoccaceae bacterium]